jgi:hypothetical protein
LFVDFYILGEDISNPEILLRAAELSLKFKEIFFKTLNQMLFIESSNHQTLRFHIEMDKILVLSNIIVSSLQI